MIKFSRSAKPAQLTTQEVKKLTDIFKKKGERVWGKKYITDPLLRMSNSKCCYCECKIDEESKYLEVEHFKPKGLYPDLVVEWDNLLPSCKHCNGQKGEHDTIIDPIINPVIDDPRSHLIVKAYRVYPRNNSSLGKLTIRVVDLNNRKRLVDVRANIGHYIHEELEKLLKINDDYLNAQPGNNKNNVKRDLINGIRKLLLECQPNSEYSATAATETLKDLNYKFVRQTMIAENIWAADLENLHSTASQIDLN